MGGDKEIRCPESEGERRPKRFETALGGLLEEKPGKSERGRET